MVPDVPVSSETSSTRKAASGVAVIYAPADGEVETCLVASPGIP